MSNILIVLFLTLVGTAVSQRVITGAYGPGEAKITPVGPHMRIDLWWKDRMECRNGRKPLYDIIYIDDQKRSTAIETKYSKSSLTIESPIENLGPLNILFWSRHKITVYSDCPWTHQVDRFVLEERGELLPVESIDFKPEKNSAILTWTLSTLQNVATHVLVKTCRSEKEGKCTEETELPISQENFTIEGLTPGIQETVFVRLEKLNRRAAADYSAPLNITIEALPPAEEDFPSVQKLSVHLIRNGSDDADINVSYAKPQNIPNGHEWSGIEAQIVDTFGNVVLETRTQDLDFNVTGLSLFTDLTVHVRAIYIFNKDEVLSPTKTLDFYTGIGHLAKPILRVYAIDSTKALVTWQHAPKDSYEVNFTVQWGEQQKEIPMSLKNYAVLDRLTPEQTYDVNMTAHVEHEGRQFHNTSDTKQVTMLPRDALKARVSCKKIEREGMELAWDVVMPADPKYCRFYVKVCPESGTVRCLERYAIYNGERGVTVDFFPFENQTIEVATTCYHYHDVIVRKVSDPLTVFGAFKLAPVKDLEVVAKDDSSVEVSFGQVPEEAKFVEGYEITWLADGADASEKKQTRTSEKSIGLANLKSGTTYHITVAPFTSQERGGLLGLESQASALTQLPVPPSVTDLRATQGDMAYDWALEWKMPPYPYDIVYEIRALCGSWTRDFASSETSFHAVVTATHEQNCTFSVRAATNVPAQPKKLSEATSVTRTFEGLEPPREIKMTGCAERFRYDLEIVPPDSAKSLDIRYQLSEASRDYGSRFKESSTQYTSPKFGIPIEVKARICYKSVCSVDTKLTFTTNSAAPGAIDNMNITTRDETKILLQWGKPSNPLGPIDGYLIEIKDGETKKTKAVSLLGTETSYTFESDKEYVEYSIEYSAFNDNRCGSGRFTGLLTKARFTTSGKRSPPPKEFHTESLGTQHGINWDPPRGVAVKKYHIVGTPATEDSYGPVNDNKTVDVFTKEPRISFSFFKPYTEYVVEVSSCTGDDVESCGRGFSHRMKTEAGHPGRLAAKMVEQSSNSISLIWTPPVDPAGPIDGYRLAFQDRSTGESPINWTDYHNDLHFAVLRNLTEDTEYVIHVQAYNFDSSDEKLASPVAVVNAKTLGKIGSASAAQVGLSILVVAVVFAAIGFISYKVVSKRPREDTQRLTDSVIDLQETATTLS